MIFAYEDTIRNVVIHTLKDFLSLSSTAENIGYELTVAFKRITVREREEGRINYPMVFVDSMLNPSEDLIKVDSHINADRKSVFISIVFPGLEHVMNLDSDSERDIFRRQVEIIMDGISTALKNYDVGSDIVSAAAKIQSDSLDNMFTPDDIEFLKSFKIKESIDKLPTSSFIKKKFTSN